jgi:hypothetical protein
MGVRLTANQVLAYVPDQDDPIQLVGYGTTTSAGAADGTTLVDADSIANSGSANTYNGRYWIELLSGTYKGLQRRVVDDDGAGALTLEGTGFPGQVASGVEFRLWKTSEALIVVDSSGAATAIVDAERDEADDSWIGYGVEPITGARAGEAKAVSDFVSVSGTFTVGAFTGVLAAGDVCYLRRPLEAGNVAITAEQPLVATPSFRSDFSAGPGYPGARSASISFDIQAKGSGSLSAAGVQATESEIGGLLQACGYVCEIGRTLTVNDASATTTSIDINTATHEFVDIGQAIMHQGNVAWVTAKTDGGAGVDNLTVAPPLPRAPNTGDLLYACRMYRPDVDALRKGVTIYFERDGYRYTLFGCMGTVDFTPGDATEMVAKFSFTATHYAVEVEDNDAGDALHSLYSTARVILGAERIAYFGTTKVDISGVNVAAGGQAVKKKTSGAYGISGTSGMQTTAVKPKITFAKLIEDSGDALDAELLYQTRTGTAVSLVYGSHGNCIAFRAPVARLETLPAPTEDEGMLATPYAFDPQSAGTATDPTDGVVKVPNFSICIF